MANRLEKIPQIVVGGGGSGSSGPGSGGATPGGNPDAPSTGLPPQGSRCYQDLFAKVAQMWPNHVITRVNPDKGGDYLRVSDFSNGYVWRVTGTCLNGYIKIDYKLLQSPGVGSS